MYPNANQYSHEPKYTADGRPSPGDVQSNPPTIAQPYHPPPHYIPRQIHGTVNAVKWSTGLCHCCDDPANCAVTLFCPCITFGQIAEIVDKGESGCGSSGTVFGLLALTGLACLYSCGYRSKLRGQYDLVESPCVDCLVHFCCGPCALCQEYRELKNRGYDLGIGWEANLERQQRGVTSAPIITPSMAR